MKVDILTLFPKMFENILGESMLKIAQKKSKLKIGVHNLRQWTSDRHRSADDRPYGGGSGMVMLVEPIQKALVSLLGKNEFKNIRSKKRAAKGTRVVLLTPKGDTFNQRNAKRFSKLRHLVLICGHYEGIDERVREFITDEVSIGDYILTGGEIPAMAVLDAVVRLIPGVLGDEGSLHCESFEKNLLEYPHYTRPRAFLGLRVPDVLLSGNHKKIASWRQKEAVKKTKEKRRDLMFDNSIK